MTFLPDGTTKEDVEIVFTGAGARPLDVKLRALTGAVSVQPLNVRATKDAERHLAARQLIERRRAHGSYREPQPDRARDQPQWIPAEHAESIL